MSSMRPRSMSAPRRDDGNYGTLGPTATGSDDKQQRFSQQRFSRSKSSEKQRSSTPKRRWNFLRRKRNDEDVTDQPIPDERRDASREYDSNLTKCDCCEVSKSRDEMYERNGYVYCSTKCTKEHQQYLSSQGKSEEFGNNTPGFGTYLNSNNSISQSMSSGSRQLESYSTELTSAPHHMNQHSNVTKKLNSSPFKSRQKTGLIRNEHLAGRGISDEYADYNDELSRQLRMASRQDKLEREEKQFQREQFMQKTRTRGINHGRSTGFDRPTRNKTAKWRLALYFIGQYRRYIIASSNEYEIGCRDEQVDKKNTKAQK
ncbi:hypothetical protein THAOC_18956 [Thalassiosira oceanica]|uniref:Uncharacterized protein n=1 Tax=Thalassiosira oceanica TaxID=159749 RepID=K0S5X8_THAOC|nr:hypothetical protein THAOC_18956 [Thalassiosira oceanica]|eukprot:EJK60650.1 hypothetical protein THAOC_18956 [Thalassiosira oceanica]